MSNLEEGNNIEINRKNRTLQYYKFLFYSIKTEIKLHDFIKLYRTCNLGEIALWVMSVIILISTPKDFPKLAPGEKSTKYSTAFIWLHIIHVFRGALGIFLIMTFPKSNYVINSLESYSNQKFEKTLFNDLIRESIFFNVTEKIKPKKLLVIIFLILTLVNVFFDCLDFLIILFSLSGAKSDAKVVFLAYFIISILYIYIDLSFVFWIEHLKYVFPHEYLKSIESLFFGIVDRVLVKFKLKKPKTNVISEANAQNSGKLYVNSNDMRNGGVNILENILGDSFGFSSGRSNVDEKNKIEKNIDNRQKYSDNINNIPRSEDQMNN